MDAVGTTRPADQEPDYSVIIPAYNEAEFLPDTLRTLARVMSQEPRRGEVVVVDNNSTDGTGEIARDHGATVVFEPVNQISRARNAGAAAASGRYLIFLDADTRVGERTLSQALCQMASGEICGGGAAVSMSHPNRFAKLAVTAWNGLARRTGLAAGCFLFCLREAFSETGGFSEKVYASEEIWLSFALGRWGRARAQRFVILDETVSTSARKMDWLSPGMMARQVLIFVVFPFAVRSKRFCGAWYVRPRKRGKRIP